MIGRDWSRRTKRGVAACSVALIAMGGVGWAAIPASDGTIKGCYANADGRTFSKGDVRVVDSAENCRWYETAINWSQRGPQGPKGDPGSPGISGYEVVEKTGEFQGPAWTVDIMVSCPAGKVPMGGGARGRVWLINGIFVDESKAIDLVSSEPRAAGWYVELAKTDGSPFAPNEDVFYAAYAICVKVAS